jgi:hypothetical protein
MSEEETPSSYGYVVLPALAEHFLIYFLPIAVGLSTLMGLPPA